MASLRDIRKRIRSVKNTQQITKAMKMVAAAKLRRAQDAIIAARPYAQTLDSIIHDLAARSEGELSHPLLVAREPKNVELLVLTSDRGLAGGFNSSVARAARDHISALLAQGQDVKIICIGRKGRDVLRRLFGDRVIATFEVPKVLGMDGARPVAELILQKFEAGEADVVTLFYSRFKSVISQVPTARQLIPAVVDANDVGGAAPDLKGGVYTYEPDEASILETLLPRNLAIQILSAMYENQAGFYAAQMSAMDNATRNAGDMIAALSLQYNRSRQAQITKELIEIISGAEAL